MSKYGYLEVFQSPLDFEITGVDCTCTVAYANSVDPDQTAPSGSTQFAIPVNILWDKEKK